MSGQPRPAMPTPGAAPSSATPTGRQSEFIIRVPEPNPARKYSVLKFNQGLKTDFLQLDPAQWTTPQYQLQLAREENRAVISGIPSAQNYGEGSEYGKAARDEARRKRLGRQAKSYSIDRQPWKMKLTENGRERKFQSIREGAGVHADYWLFMKASDEFLAYKVDDWHNFIPAVTHRTLDIDEAEEEFTKRNRVMNQFALRAQIMDKLKTKDDDEEDAKAKGVGGLKIKDELSSSDEDGDEKEDKDDEDKEEKQRKKKLTKKGVKPRKDKKVKVENSEDVAKYESEDGEDEGREYNDYMSDSGSDSDREDPPMEEKVEKALVGVAEEEGMRKMMNSDEESSSEDEDPTKKLLNKDEDGKKRNHMDIEERDSSGSDSEVDEIDKDNKDYAILMPKKVGSPPVEEKMEGIAANGGGGVKRPAEDPAKAPDAKRPKEEKEEGLTEELVRRLLRSKPHTTKELLSKIKSRCGQDMPKPEMVTKLAQILKAIEPDQFKQKQGKKDVLFFSLANTIS